MRAYTCVCVCVCVCVCHSSKVCETLMESTLRLHEVGLAVDDAKRELMAKSAVIRAWATTYTQRDPQQATELRMGPGHKGTRTHTHTYIHTHTQASLLIPHAFAFVFKGSVRHTLYTCAGRRGSAPVCVCVCVCVRRRPSPPGCYNRGIRH